MITEFAPAKINLALHVLGRRADGLHELDSIVAFADVGDRLTFEPAEQFGIVGEGPFAGKLPPPTDNIVHRAFRALAEFAKAQGAEIAPVRILLEKNLPVSSGIGGGSANAAATLRVLVKMNRLSIAADDLNRIALALGADVPVCLLGKAARMRGVGDRLVPLEDFTPLPAVLVNPMIEVSTAAVFQKLGLNNGENNATPISPSPLRGGWREAPGGGLLVSAGATPTRDYATWRNDLTAPAIAVAPVIAEVLAALQAQPGLRFARMSGSGATCFGIFENVAMARDAANRVARANPLWWVKQVLLS